ncbi:hypothetical protein Scep_007465 [Stephania cephalantha]|uniref:Uncharacterized protein n=1 Tax=Stephania cephalantha TaxID=152367 RepID=A0AAP0K9W6_9MAGN
MKIALLLLLKSNRSMQNREGERRRRATGRGRGGPGLAKKMSKTGKEVRISSAVGDDPTTPRPKNVYIENEDLNKICDGTKET